MKNLYKKILLVTAALSCQTAIEAQCATTMTIGSASNMFTLIRNGNNPIAVNKSMNMVAFIHRNNAGVFGGGSGNLRYDISANGGAAWTLNQGVLNPLNSNPGRYPNLTIYNPVANTNTANAYVSYLAPTLDLATQSIWNGCVTGVRQLNNTGNTETYNQNGIGTNQIPHSLVNGAPGVVWGIDPIVPLGTTGYNIYKGVWNGTSDFVWSINAVISPPYNTGWTTFPPATDYNIGFDPTGTIGYISIMAHVTPGPTPYALYPVLYKTVNGGTSWTGPIQVDLNGFSCISSNLSSPNGPTANLEHDLIVDVNGNPHIVTTLGGGTNYSFSYTTWHHMYDITITDGVWAAYDLGNVNGAPYTSGVTPNFAVQTQAPQASRTADGTKVFFTWTDNSTYIAGALNTTPNLFAKSYDVVQRKWTQTKDFTSCNVATDGKIIFPHMAPEVLEPSANVYKIAVVYGEVTVPNDLGQVANFKFLDNTTFVAADYSIVTPTANITIQQAPSVIVCPGSTLTINVGGTPGQSLWSTGATTHTLSVTSGPSTIYTVTSQVGCNVGSATIAAVNLTLNASSLTPTLCPGDAANLSVLGNGLAYSWEPGTLTGTNVTLYPTTSPVTLTAMGSNGCTMTNTVSVNILPPPVLTITGNNTVCAGHVLSQTAGGAQTYVWNGTTSGATFTDMPTSNINYVVVGTGANGCTSTQNINVAVKPSPVLTTMHSATAVCSGDPVFLFASGAVTYSWNGVLSTPNTSVIVTTNSVYTVVGVGPNLCETTSTIAVQVYALPTITITPSKPTFCAGERLTLTASGASNYTWSLAGQLTSVALVSPTVTTVYSVNAENSNFCKGSGSYTVDVQPCTGIVSHDINSNLMIYPNPNNGEFTIKGYSDITFQIINELGQVIEKVILNENNSHSVLIKNLPAGIYFAVGQNPSEMVKQKIVISK